MSNLKLCIDCNNIYNLFVLYYDSRKKINPKKQNNNNTNYKSCNNCYLLLKNMMETFHKESMIYLQQIADENSIDVNILINTYYDNTLI